MNFGDEIAFGHFTLAQLSQLIDENLAAAKYLNVKLTWGFSNRRMYARIIDGDNLIYERYYQGQHTHVHLAHMHLHFSQRLSALTVQRRAPFRPKKGASDSGMTLAEKALKLKNS